MTSLETRQQIKVEFFGIPRLRTGVSETLVDCLSEKVTLSELLKILSRRFPEFGKQCVEGQNAGDYKLSRALIANIDGKEFTSSPLAEIYPNQTLIVMSSDAGG